jgi:hypothetical protein
MVREVLATTNVVDKFLNKKGEHVFESTRCATLNREGSNNGEETPPRFNSNGPLRSSANRGVLIAVWAGVTKF